MLGERCDDLQGQIKNMEKEKLRGWDEHVEKAKESLLTREDFNFEGHSASTGSISDFDRDDIVPTLGKFESSKAKYLDNLETERFK